mgnify:CR=1 FL=1
MDKLHTDLILEHARLLLPDAYQRPIADGAIAIQNGKIVDYGTSEQINSQYQAPQRLDMTGKLLMPGLVDCHNHLGNWNMYAITGLLSEPVIKQPDRLLKVIYPAYTLIDEVDSYDVNMMGYLNAIKTGTTTVANSYIWTDEVARAAVDSGLRVDLAPCIHQSIGYPDSKSIEDDLVQAESMIQKWHGAAEGRIRYRLQPETSYQCEEWVFEACARLAAQYHVGLATHIAEDQNATAKAARIWPEGELRKLYQTGFIGPNTLLYHGSLLRGSDLELLASSGAAIAHCPISNLKRGAVAAVPEMLRLGVRVGLGVDYPNNDLFNVMRIASLIHTILPEDHKGLSEKESLFLATQGGADALGIGDEVGSIAVGKKADLITLDTHNNTRLFPIWEETAVNMIRLNGAGQDVSDVIVDGKILMRNKEVLVCNETEVVRRGLEQQKKFRERYLRYQAEGKPFVPIRNEQLLNIQQK